jgi:hypothetical protein
MEIDDAIVQLGAKLDAWLDGNLATISSMDRVAQFKALLAGIEFTKELDLLKAKGMAAITALLDRQDAATEDERVASLIRGFEFAAKLADTLHDELLDVNGETAVLRLKGAIVDKLDTLGSGRAALAVLLDHADAGVRAQAGASLLRLMPERVLPILRQIEEQGNWESAGFRAHWAIVGWEREGMHNKKSEPPT